MSWDLGWSNLQQKLMVGSRCLATAISVQDFVVILDMPLTTLEILIYYYIFLEAVYTGLAGILQ